MRAADPSGDDARLAVDGRDDTAWTGAPGETRWKWSAAFAQPVHVGLVRARFGSVADERRPHCLPLGGAPGGARSDARARPLAADERRRLGRARRRRAVAGARPRTARAADASIVVRRRRRVRSAARHRPDQRRSARRARGAGHRGRARRPARRRGERRRRVPRLRRGGRDRRDVRAAAGPGPRASRAGRFASTCREPQPVDRVRLVLGFDATSVPRPGSGRSYADRRGRRCTTLLEASEDGKRFVAVAERAASRRTARSCRCAAAWSTLPEPRTVRALRLVMAGRHRARAGCPRRARCRSSASWRRTGPTTRAPSSPRRGSSASTPTPRRSPTSRRAAR